jgi:hypothetical protein
MADGKRLENLSWRIYSRETFCCAPDLAQSSRLAFDRKRKSSPPQTLPHLSSSVDSDSSDEALEISARLLPSRPHLRRLDSTDSRNRKEKHITSIDLEKIVNTIKEKQDLGPLSPLPSSLTPAEPATQVPTKFVPATPLKESIPQPVPSRAQPVPESTVASTVAYSDKSDMTDMSPPFASCETTSTELSSTSIVRGFSKEHISSSLRSRQQLAPTPIAAARSAAFMNRGPHPPPTSAAPAKGKGGAQFLLGGSSGEGDDSSFENSYRSRHAESSLSAQLRRNPSEKKKMTSFNEEVATRTIQDRPYESEEVFEETDDEEDQSESAIEDDDVDEDWEDDDEPGSPPSANNQELFQRVDSRPNLVSRRSMLTSLMHEKDRSAYLLQNANSRSSPAIRRSRTTSPNGPLGTSPPTSIAQGLGQPSRARPIIMTTSNTHPPALSPRTTRRNMLSTELTESLRKHLLWERQVPRCTTNAALKRRHTAHDMKNLQHYPGDNQPTTHLAPNLEPKNGNSWNNYFDTGLQEYHQKGW